jgi:DNA-binding response OmpR family regulator
LITYDNLIYYKGEDNATIPSDLNPCPPIGDHHIQRSDEHKALIIDHKMGKFTPTEYRLLIPLLNGQPVSDISLIQEAFTCDASPQIRKSMEKHIDNIRSKLHLCGLTIHRITKFGYVLLEAPG